MPIPKEQFEKIDDTHNIVASFLQKNPDKAFTQKEIAEAVGLDKSTVSYHISRLSSNKQIRTKWRGKHKYIMWREAGEEEEKEEAEVKASEKSQKGVDEMLAPFATEKGKEKHGLKEGEEK